MGQLIWWQFQVLFSSLLFLNMPVQKGIPIHFPIFLSISTLLIKPSLAAHLPWIILLLNHTILLGSTSHTVKWLLPKDTALTSWYYWSPFTEPMWTYSWGDTSRKAPAIYILIQVDDNIIRQTLKYPAIAIPWSILAEFQFCCTAITAASLQWWASILLPLSYLYQCSTLPGMYGILY